MGLTKTLPDSIKVKVRATHYNYVNKNFVMYSTRAVTDGIKSWTKPYNKPQLVFHDKDTDPIGRVIDARLAESDNTNEPPDYVELTVEIVDESAIEKVLDGRYNTVSVGSRSSRVSCSECSQVLTEEGLCDHKKGSFNESGEVIYWIIDQIDYVEDSFVNEPADPYTKIDSIDIGTGWIDYKVVLDNRETLLTDIFSMEDSIMKHSDTKLTAAQRKKLPDSVFCGPDRSFPAHDKDHVISGIKLLDSAELSDSTKKKIKACLLRKGKRFGIVPTQDELKEDQNILTYRIDEDHTEEELTAISDWFKANPDSDLPTELSDDNASEDNVVKDDDKDIRSLKKDELIEKCTLLDSELGECKDKLSTSEERIKELEDSLEKSEVKINEREDEINKYLDKLAIADKKVKDGIISHILTLKKVDTNDEYEAAVETYQSRSIESLEDTLTDLSIVFKDENKSVITDKKVEAADADSTTTESEINLEDSNDDKTTTSRFAIFSEDKNEMEAE